MEEGLQTLHHIHPWHLYHEILIDIPGYTWQGARFGKERLFWSILHYDEKSVKLVKGYMVKLGFHLYFQKHHMETIWRFHDKELHI